MKIGINQFCWPTSVDVKESIEKSAKLGFESFEACFTLGEHMQAKADGVTDALGIESYYNRLLNVNSSEKDVFQLKKIAEEAGMRIGSVGGVVTFSVYSLMSPQKKTAEKSMDAVKKMMDAAEILEAKNVLVIPGMLEKGMEYEAAYERVQGRISKLAEHSSKVNLAVENVWNNFLYSPLEMKRFVQEINKPNVGIYFDVGNAKRFGYPEDWIITLCKHIKGIHVKDYRMAIDNINGFTNVLDGDVNWPDVIKALNTISYSGDLILELIPPAHHLASCTLAHGLNVLKQLTQHNGGI